MKREGVQKRFPGFSSSKRWVSCYQFFLIRSTDPVIQELSWRLVAEGRMQPFPVVGSLDVLEAGHRLSVRVVSRIRRS